MATSRDIAHWEQGLRAWLPFFGPRTRRATIEQLTAQRHDADVVPLLVKALGNSVPEVAAQAARALHDLTAAEAIDALCAIWAERRDAKLGRIIAEKKYLASKPARLRALSGLRAGAVETLSTAGGDVIQEVLGAMSDPPLRGTALQVLQQLSSPAAIDALCAIWAERRDATLGRIIAEKKYLASKPTELRALSALKGGRVVAVERAEQVPLFIRLLDDPDPVLRDGARRCLEQIRPGPAQDALCDLAIEEPQGPIAQLCLRTGKRPSDEERVFLFLFVTRQFDEYFQHDPAGEFRELHRQYERADAKVQAHVMEIVRSGDRRCAGFFGARTRPLSECNDHEIRLALQSGLRHQDWPRLFQAVLELPLKYSFPLLQALRKSGWRPAEPERNSLFQRLLADLGDQATTPEKPPPATSAYFERQLAAGRTGELAKLSDSELLSRLASAAPPEGIALVAALATLVQLGSPAALATQVQLGSPAAQAVGNSPHWLIRLAGHAVGLCGDLTSDGPNDPNYWINALVTSAGVLELWPGKATPADLNALQNAPGEAWVGRLGTVRKVLRSVLAYRVTTGTFEPLVVEASEFAAEFVDADETAGS